MPKRVTTARGTTESTSTSGEDVLKDPLRDREQKLYAEGPLGDGLTVSTIAEGLPAMDGLSTSSLFQYLAKKYPDRSDKELWTWAVQYDVNAGGQVTETEGDEFAGTKFFQRKKAYVMGNKEYLSPMKKLPGAMRDAKGMASHYKGKGFTVMEQYDGDASAMRRRIDLADSVGPGDEVVIYYAGHGTDEGIIGVKGGLLRHQELASKQAGALGKGADATLVVDACDSGALQDELYEEVGALAGQTNEMDLPDYDHGRETWMGSLKDQPFADLPDTATDESKWDLREWYQRRVEEGRG